MADFKELDPVLHQSLRLAVISLLASVESAEFVYLRDQTKSTAGNLSIQLDRLKEAGYIQIVKDFNGKKPRTTCNITPAGKNALKDYVVALKTYLNL
jgi:DNA-binding MarR family transcriptional regulator